MPAPLLLLRPVAAHLSIILLISLLLSTAGRAQAPTATPVWQSVVPLALNGGSQTWASTTDDSGHIYITGDYSGTAHFGSITMTSFGRRSAYLAKWNSHTNTYVWVQSIHNMTGPVALVRSGNHLYFASSFSGSLQLNGAPLPITSSAGTLLAKFTDAGATASLAWALTLAGQGEHDVTALAVNGPNVYMGGYFSGTATFGSTQLASAALYDGYVAKLTDAGSSASVTWVQQISGPELEYVESLAVEGANVYVAGLSTSTQFSIGGTAQAPGSGPLQGFLAKLVDNGTSSTLRWAQNTTATGHGFIQALGIRGGSLYAAGSGPSASPQSPEDEKDGFVARFQDEGSTLRRQWLLPVVGPGDDFVTTLTLEANGSHLFIGGIFRGSSVRLGGFTLANPYQPQPPAYRRSTPLLAARLTDLDSTAAVDYVLTSSGGPSDVYIKSINPIGGRVFVTGHTGSSTSFGPHQLATSDLTGFLASFGAPLTTAARPPLPAEVALYPNPARLSTTVRLPPLPGTTATLVLTDALGRIVRTHTIGLSAAGTRFSLPLEALPAGLYRLQVRAGQYAGSLAIVVQE